MSKASPIIIRERKNPRKTENFFERHREKKIAEVLNRLGQRGVDALAAATPVRTGKTAASWRYEVNIDQKTVSIQWINDNATRDGDSIVKLLVRGHGTRDGHYVSGNDFVTPAIEPIFKEISDEAWAEVTK